MAWLTDLLPSPANAGYRGAPSAAAFLGLLAVGTIVPGLIHSFLPDGGAAVIAGVDFGDRREIIVGLFAWAGATQIVHGLMLLAVALRYRTLVPLGLALLLLERGMLVAHWWLLTPVSSGHHPPEHYASVAILPLLAVFLWLSLRRPIHVQGAPT